MKKFLFIIATMLAIGTSTTRADIDTPISAAQLPQKAQVFIKQHFPNREIAYAKLERDFPGLSYEVILTNSTKLEFNKDGEWKEVDCKYKPVPAAIVPEAIAAFTTMHYPNVIIVKIDRDSRGYEVDLSNGLELTFDLKFNLIEIDD